MFEFYQENRHGSHKSHRCIVPRLTNTVNYTELSKHFNQIPVQKITLLILQSQKFVDVDTRRNCRRPMGRLYRIRNQLGNRLKGQLREMFFLPFHAL